MNRLAFHTMILAFSCSMAAPATAQDTGKQEAKEKVCFESRKGASEITQRELKPGLLNVRCSPTTDAVLWYGDPYEGTVPMGKMPLVDKTPLGNAVVKPRTEKLNLVSTCTMACHNGVTPPGFPKHKKPVPIPTMEAMVPEVKDLQHGRGRIWCLDCHHPTKRDKLVDHFGDTVSFDQPQQLCGKCHGDKLRDWRDGIHGKRIGEFASTGKKRWFVCTECHNPHDVQNGAHQRGFTQLQPEPPPQLPFGMKDAKHEKQHAIPH
jgi:hypothetical protein